MRRAVVAPLSIFADHPAFAPAESEPGEIATCATLAGNRPITSKTRAGSTFMRAARRR